MFYSNILNRKDVGLYGKEYNNIKLFFFKSIKRGKMEYKENHERHNLPTNQKPMAHDHTNHHSLMAEDFKKRFIISTFVTIFILILFP